MSESGRAKQRDGPRKVVARAHGGVHAPNTVERCVNLDQRVLNGAERRKCDTEDELPRTRHEHIRSRDIQQAPGPRDEQHNE